MASHYHTTPEEKPYRFVSLADRVERQPIISHQQMEKDRWYGYFKLVLTAESPVHVASGLIVHRNDLKPYIGKDLDAENEDALILSHVRHNEQRYIPGSSLKGVVRSVIEAITYSCLCNINNEEISKEAQKKDEYLKILSSQCTLETGLCPACRLFGTLGYQGRVNFHDTVQLSGGGRIARRPVAHPPQPERSQANNHRTQSKLYYSRSREKLKGRKLYLHGQQPIDMTQKYEAVEVCKKDSTFEGRVDINGLSTAELGLLLKGLGFDQQFRLKVGGSKPFGYGSVKVNIPEEDIYLTREPVSLYKEYATEKKGPTDNGKLLATSLQAAERSNLIRQDAWDELLKLMKMDLIAQEGKY